MFNFLKNLVLKIIFPNSYSSEALIKYINSHGGKIGTHSHIFGSCRHRIDLANVRFMEIGDYCLIAPGAAVLAHDYSYTVLANAYHEICRKQRITRIGNNVFIGMNSIVLMGAEIGDNVIIGAGSVVSGKVESNSVYAGNPARKICSLDEYYQKRKGDLVNSAAIFASKTNSPEDMLCYRILLEDEDQFKKYMLSKTFNGISHNTIKQLHMPEEKLTWEELKTGIPDV